MNIRASPSIGEAAYAKGQKITNTNYHELTRIIMKEAFLEDFDTLLHDYIASGEYEDVSEEKTLCHIDDHKYKVELKVTRI